MINTELTTLKTKNTKKKSVEVKPTNIPLFIEREFKNSIMLFSNSFKAQITLVLFPLLKTIGLAKDSKITSDGIGDILNTHLEMLKSNFNYSLEADRIAADMVNKVSAINKKSITNKIDNAIGVDINAIIANENLEDFIELKTLENAQLIKSVPNNAIEDIRRIVINGYSNGIRAEEIERQIRGRSPNSVFNKVNNRISTIARTEVAKLNSQITNKRLLNIGVTKARWDATMDSATRESHKDRDGKIFDIEKGLYSSKDGKWLHTGQDYNCRCVSRPIIE